MNYGYGLGGYGGFGGYYPFAGAQLATTYTGLPAAGYPYYGYPSVTASKYHAQDELGQARFGYAHPGQAATNYRDAFGNQIGSYAYFNPEGKEVRVSYTADHRGFRVLSNDLPVAPVANLVAPVQVQDTPEVAAAKATHLAAINAAKTGVAAPVAAVAPVAALPAPVQDTAEVAAAKAEHAAKWAAAKSAATPVSRSKRQALSYNVPLAYNYGTSPLAFSYGASPLAYNYGSHLGYNAAVGSPFGYNYGTPFGYSYNHPLAYNQHPFNFGTVPYVTPVATTTTKIA